jgi:hypothetical protein
MHFWRGYPAADANASRPADRLASALRWGATAVQHQGTLLSRVDDRIPVHVTVADPMSHLASSRRPDEDLELLASDCYVDPASALVSPENHNGGVYGSDQRLV